ncbi:MAG: DNA polymerase III subunit gamma/tau [Flavobacteriales bacterium]|nr:DNA polymerase III subunit gamma/tau [Flavobacteriales bacterium]MCB9167624.1 DNA polymerase III subunit gamma/tau [Flavobacteriales bacterium]
MDKFVVSARKYRPATFDTVVGQEAVTGTLKNAIRNAHLAQAFLFCGPRGVGKTTCARILARTINCEDLGDDLVPCGKCDPCRTFEEGHSLNIYELDAASNNSVDNIRDLILQVQIAPQVGSRKVYIIDEVHMLSQSAFNAFLKTLEEPPSYAIFILATTEKHKILPTILSRCQVFDFRRITISDMVEHLRSIADREGVEVDPQALHVIAQKADGGLRDALSIFDQMVSFSGHRLTYQDVVKNLNVLDHDHYFRLTEQVLRGDVPACLVEFDAILQNGFDGHLFVSGLARHFRDMLVCKDPRSADLLEVSEEVAKRYVEQASTCTHDLLVRGLELLGQCDVRYKASKEPRMLVELTLIQLCGLNGEDRSGSSSNGATRGSHHAETAVEEKKSPDVIVPAALVAEPAPEVPRTEPQRTGEERSSAPIRRLAGAASLKELARRPGEVIAANDGPLPASAPHVRPEPRPVNESLLRKVWQDFALARKREGQNSLHATLVAHEPVVVGLSSIRFRIVNEVQEKYLREVGIELLEHLRNALDDRALDLKVEKEEVTDLRPRYTPMDRFKIMAEQNPALLKLKEDLDLDLG